MRIDPHNVLSMPIVSGDYATTSLSSEGVSQNSAEGITLIAAVQTRSNNRFVIAGSLEFFSDSYYEENADNKILGDQISLCTFLFLSLPCRAVQVRRVSACPEHRARQIHPSRGPNRNDARDSGAGSRAAQSPHIPVDFHPLDSPLATDDPKWQATTWCIA